MTSNAPNQRVVLVVNDAVDQRSMMETLLTLAGYSVLIASSGSEGYQIASSSPVDLIVSDVVMPGGDGIELCRSIRSEQRLAMVPILLVSALKKDAESAVAGLSAGADDYLEVPFEPMHFVAKVSRMLERGRLEEELRKSEERFRAVYENAAIGIALVDKDGSILGCNQSMEKMLGYTEEQLRTKTLDELTATADGGDDAVPSTLLFDPGQEGYQVERTYRRSDGTLMWGSLNVSSVRSAGGAVEFFVAMIKDITARKRAEEALRENEERFHLVSAATNDALWDYDPVSGSLWVNETHANLLGYDRSEVTPSYDTWRSALHPEDADRVMAELSEAVARRDATWSSEYRICRPDGSHLCVLDRGKLLYGDDGSVVRMIGGMVDVTERKLVEAAIAQSERDYRTIFEQAHDAIIIFSPTRWTILDANERACELYGRRRDEFIGRPMIEMLKYPDVARERIQRLLNGEGPLNFESVHERSDGTPMYLEINSSLVDYKGERAVISINRDITERRRAAEEIRRKDEQLRQSQKLESVGRLAGGIAHDFNNMVTAINGYSELILRRQDLDASIRRSLEEIRKAGDRSAALTKQLLAFSRRQMLQVMVVDVNEIIAETNKMLRRLIGEDIQLNTLLCPELWPVEADPVQLTQVIMNLAVNARDAMPGGGTLTIETDNVELDEHSSERRGVARPGHYVRITVRDTGQGIEPDDLKQIFEPFFTTKELGKGTGLGLATVYGIVKQSNGYIWADSEPASGSTFTIYLPRIANGASPSEHREAAAAIPAGRGTVLVVEDEDLVRTLTRQVLEQCGYDVVEARDGLDALGKGDEFGWKFDLLMTDVVMPNMGGRELVARLAERGSQVPVLFTSGYTDDNIIRHDVIKPDADFIQKPFTAESLAHKVREILGRAASR
ncbi:MAG: PAS domain S-box protein [Pyrinomonadaceae bacterium]